MAKAARGSDGYLLFWCPGCDEAHGIPVDGSRGWTWNGSLEAPTVSPSILVRSTRYGPDKVAFGKYDGPFPCEGSEWVCHSFLREGQIDFCGDSSHALAGKTVDLPEWE